jgi:hypothetical protein
VEESIFRSSEIDARGSGPGGRNGELRGGVFQEEARGDLQRGRGREAEVAASARERESRRQRRHRIWLRRGWGMKKVGRRVCWEKNGEFLAKWPPHHLNPDEGSNK